MNGVLDRVFEHLQREQIVSSRQARSGVAGQHHRPGPSRRTGALKKRSYQAIVPIPRRLDHQDSIWLPRMLERPSPSRSPLDKPTISRNRRASAAESPWSATRQSLADHGSFAYEGNETRQLALALGFIPVVRTIRFAAGKAHGNTTGRCTSGATKIATLVIVGLEGIPKNLLTLREARRDLPRVSSSSHSSSRRCVSVNRP